MAVAENLKKELSEKAEEAKRSEARVRELEEREGELIEHNWAVAEEHDHKVTELTQLGDQVQSLRRRLEESEKARADNKVIITFLVFSFLPLFPLS